MHNELSRLSDMSYRCTSIHQLIVSEIMCKISDENIIIMPWQDKHSTIKIPLIDLICQLSDPNIVMQTRVEYSLNQSSQLQDH